MIIEIYFKDYPKTNSLGHWRALPPGPHEGGGALKVHLLMGICTYITVCRLGPLVHLPQNMGGGVQLVLATWLKTITFLFISTGSSLLLRLDRRKIILDFSKVVAWVVSSLLDILSNHGLVGNIDKVKTSGSCWLLRCQAIRISVLRACI
jgi:hypothetical protein